MVYRNVDGNTIVSKKPGKGTMKQTADTKKSAAFFGLCSNLGGIVRATLDGCMFPDRYMSNRVTVALRSAYARCYHQKTDTYIFGSDSFDGLTGLEFNIKSKMSDYFWPKPALSLEDDNLVLRIPEIKVLRQLKFPKGATLCEPNLFICLFSPEAGYWTGYYFKTSKINKTDDIIPAQEFKLHVPKGCVCLSAISTRYFSVSEDLKTPFNISVKFDPASIYSAIVNPGIFSYENLEGNKNNWSWEPKILVKAVFRQPGDPDPLEDLEKLVVKEELQEGPRIIHIKQRPKKEVKAPENQPQVTSTGQEHAKTLTERLEAARVMKAFGIPMAQIVDSTKLTLEEIINSL